MIWREGLLIRISKLGIKGRIFRWIEDFLQGRLIQVRIGESYSRKYIVENGTPQGSIISPLLFSILTNDVYKDIENGVEFSGRNMKFIIKKLQEAIIEEGV